jgi:hypothetical protein
VKVLPVAGAKTLEQANAYLEVEQARNAWPADTRNSHSPAASVGDSFSIRPDRGRGAIFLRRSTQWAMTKRGRNGKSDVNANQHKGCLQC